MSYFALILKCFSRGDNNFVFSGSATGYYYTEYLKMSSNKKVLDKNVYSQFWQKQNLSL